MLDERGPQCWTSLMTTTTTALSSPLWPVSTPSVSIEPSHLWWSITVGETFYIRSPSPEGRVESATCCSSASAAGIRCLSPALRLNPLISFVRDLNTKNSGWTFFWQRSQRKVYLIECLSWTRPSDNADKAVGAYGCMSYTHS